MSAKTRRSIFVLHNSRPDLFRLRFRLALFSQLDSQAHFLLLHDVEEFDLGGIDLDGHRPRSLFDARQYGIDREKLHALDDHGCIGFLGITDNIDDVYRHDAIGIPSPPTT